MNPPKLNKVKVIEKDGKFYAEIEDYILGYYHWLIKHKEAKKFYSKIVSSTRFNSKTSKDLRKLIVKANNEVHATEHKMKEPMTRTRALPDADWRVDNKLYDIEEGGSFDMLKNNKE